MWHSSAGWCSSEMSTLPRIYHGSRKTLLRRLVGNGLVQAVCGLLLADTMRTAVARLENVGLDPTTALLPCALGLVLLGCRVLEARDAERLGQEYVTRVRLRILDRVTGAGIRDSRRRRWGLAMTRVVSDLNALRNWISVGIARSLVSGVMLAVMLIGFSISGGSALKAAVLLAIASLLLALLLTHPLRGAIQDARRVRGQMANLLGERLIAATTLRHLDRRRGERIRIRRASRKLRDALVRQATVSALVRSFADSMLPLGVSVVLVIAVAGEVAVSEIASTVIVLSLVASGLRDLATAWEDRLAFSEARHRLETFLEGPKARSGRRLRRDSGEGPASVELVGVGMEGLFSGLDARIERGEWVSLEGPSASGKSTLVSILAGATAPDSGRVKIDGTRLKATNVCALQSSVQWVSPEVPLLRGTIDENLRFGFLGGEQHDVEEARLVRALETTGVGEVLARLPEGLATRVEEGGANLAQGLRSSIALVRALAIAPRLLLVDDPTFLIDRDAAQAIEGLRESWPMTVVLVGGRSLRMSCFDRVWTLDRGELRAERLETPLPLAGCAVGANV